MIHWVTRYAFTLDYFRGNRSVHYNSSYKMFLIISHLLAMAICSFVKKFAFLTGFVIVCLHPEASLVYLGFSLSKWIKLPSFLSSLYFPQYTSQAYFSLHRTMGENTHMYLFVLLSDKLFCGDLWSWVSKQNKAKQNPQIFSHFYTLINGKTRGRDNIKVQSVIPWL